MSQRAGHEYPSTPTGARRCPGAIADYRRRLVRLAGRSRVTDNRSEKELGAGDDKKQLGYQGQDDVVVTDTHVGNKRQAHVVQSTEGQLKRQLKNRHIQMISIGVRVLRLRLS